MASTTLSNLITTYLADNSSGDISATDLQTVVTKLWETSMIAGAANNNVAIFATDVHGNTGAIIDSGFSISDLPLGASVVPVISGKISYPTTGSAGDLLQYNGVTTNWVTPNKSLVGLANVDNTSDLSKPISIATQTALNNKQNAMHLSYSETASVKSYLFGENTDLGVELATAAAVPFIVKNSISFDNNSELELPNFPDETTAGVAALKESKIYYDTTESTVKFSDGSSWVNILSAAESKYDNFSSGLTSTTTQGAIDEVAAATSAIPNISHGQWVPTISAGVNLTSVSPISANYVRIGNIVMFSGSVQLDVTAAGWVDFTMTLPIPSNFSVDADANGTLTGGTGVAAEWGNGTIEADPAINELSCQLYSNFNGNGVWAFAGSFGII